MAKSGDTQNGSTQISPATVIDATGVGKVLVPGGELLLTAEYLRSGSDLLLVAADGTTVLIKNYFATEIPPVLTNAGGMAIDAALAQALAGPRAPGQYAQAGGNSGLAPIGTVESANGKVEVRHADGTRSTLQKGAVVHQGDQLLTGDGANVSLVFDDGTTFALGSGGRMVLDELVYDPATKTGSGSLSVVSGAFTFVSGQIPKTSPDALMFKTPQMSVGIRGTAGGGKVGGEGVTVVLVPEKGGYVGELSFTTSSGQTFTINTPGLGLVVSPTGVATTQAFNPGQFGSLVGNAATGSFTNSVNQGFGNPSDPDTPDAPFPNFNPPGQLNQNTPNFYDGVSKEAKTIILDAMKELRAEVRAVLGDGRADIPINQREVVDIAALAAEIAATKARVEALETEVATLETQYTAKQGTYSDLVNLKFGLPTGAGAPEGFGDGISYSGDNNVSEADAIRELISGRKWGSIDADDVTVVTYSFPGSVPVDYAGRVEAGGFQSFSDEQMDAARAALAEWAEIANIRFVEVADGAGEIRFAGTTTGPDVAWTYLPGEGVGGDVWLNADYAPNAEMTDFGQFTLLHEIGHALGLEHAGEYDLHGIAAPASTWDSRVHSVMSYFGGGLVGYADEPMAHDVAAIQAIYGARGTDLAAYYLGGLAHETAAIGAVGFDRFNIGTVPVVNGDKTDYINQDANGDGVINAADDMVGNGNGIDIDDFIEALKREIDEVNTSITTKKEAASALLATVLADPQMAALSVLVEDLRQSVTTVEVKAASAIIAAAKTQHTVIQNTISTLMSRWENGQAAAPTSAELEALNTQAALFEGVITTHKATITQAAQQYPSGAIAALATAATTNITAVIPPTVEGETTVQPLYKQQMEMLQAVSSADPTSNSYRDDAVTAWTSGSAATAEAGKEAARIAAAAKLKTAQDDSAATIAALDTARVAERPAYLDWQKKAAVATAQRAYADQDLQPSLSDAEDAVATFSSTTATVRIGNSDFTVTLGANLAVAANKAAAAFATTGADRLANLQDALAAALAAKTNATAGYNAALAQYQATHAGASVATAETYVEVKAWKAAQIIANDAHTRITNAITTLADDAVSATQKGAMVEATAVLVAQAVAATLEVKEFFASIEAQWQSAYDAADAVADAAEAAATLAQQAFDALHATVTTLETQAAAKLTATLTAIGTHAAAQGAEAAAEWYLGFAKASATLSVNTALLAQVDTAIAAAQAAETQAATARTEADEAGTHTGSAAAAQADYAAAQAAAAAAAAKYDEAVATRDAAAAKLAQAQTWNVKTDAMDAAYQNAVKAVAAALASKNAAAQSAELAQAWLNIANGTGSQQAADAAVAAANAKAIDAAREKAAAAYEEAKKLDAQADSALGEADAAADASFGATADAARDAAQTQRDGVATLLGQVQAKLAAAQNATTRAAAEQAAADARTLIDQIKTAVTATRTQADAAIDAAATAAVTAAQAQLDAAKLAVTAAEGYAVAAKTALAAAKVKLGEMTIDNFAAKRTAIAADEQAAIDAWNKDGVATDAVGKAAAVQAARNAVVGMRETLLLLGTTAADEAKAINDIIFQIETQLGKVDKAVQDAAQAKDQAAQIDDAAAARQDAFQDALDAKQAAQDAATQAANEQAAKIAETERAQDAADAQAETQALAFATQADTARAAALLARNQAEAYYETGDIAATQAAAARAQAAALDARAAFEAGAKVGLGVYKATDEIYTASEQYTLAQAYAAVAKAFSASASNLEASADSWRSGTAVTARLGAQAAYDQAAQSLSAAKTGYTQAADAANAARAATRDPMIKAAAAEAARDSQLTSRDAAAAAYNTAKAAAGNESDPLVLAYKDAWDAAKEAYTNAADAADKARAAANAAVDRAVLLDAAATTAATAYVNAQLGLADAAANQAQAQAAELIAQYTAQRQVETAMATAVAAADAALNKLTDADDGDVDYNYVATAQAQAAIAATKAASQTDYDVAAAQAAYDAAASAVTSAKLAVTAANAALISATSAHEKAATLPASMAVDLSGDGNTDNDADDPQADAITAARQSLAKAEADLAKVTGIKAEAEKQAALAESYAQQAFESLTKAKSFQAADDAVNAQSLEAAKAAAVAAAATAQSAAAKAADAALAAKNARDLIDGTGSGDLRTTLDAEITSAGTRITAFTSRRDTLAQKIADLDTRLAALPDGATKTALTAARDAAATAKAQADLAITAATTTRTGAAATAQTAYAAAQAAYDDGTSGDAESQAALAQAKYNDGDAATADAASKAAEAQAATTLETAQAAASAAAGFAKEATAASEIVAGKAATAQQQVKIVANLQAEVSKSVADAATKLADAETKATIAVARADASDDSTTATAAVGATGGAVDAVDNAAAATAAKAAAATDLGVIDAAYAARVTGQSDVASSDREARALIETAAKKAALAKAALDSAELQATQALGTSTDAATVKTAYGQLKLLTDTKAKLDSTTTVPSAGQAQEYAKTIDDARIEIERLATIVGAAKTTADAERAKIAAELTGVNAATTMLDQADIAKGKYDIAAAQLAIAKAQAAEAATQAANAKTYADNASQAALNGGSHDDKTVAEWRDMAVDAREAAETARDNAATAKTAAIAASDDASAAAAVAETARALTTLTSASGAKGWADKADAAEASAIAQWTDAERALSTAQAAETAATAAVTAYANGTAAEAAVDTAVANAQRSAADSEAAKTDAAAAKANVSTALGVALAGGGYTDGSVLDKLADVIADITTWKTTHSTADHTVANAILAKATALQTKAGTIQQAVDTAATTATSKDSEADALVVQLGELDAAADPNSNADVPGARTKAEAAAAAAAAARTQATIAQQQASAATQVVTDATALESAFAGWKSQVEQQDKLAKQQAAQTEAINAAADARNDTASVSEDGSLTVNVLANDTRADGAALNLAKIVALGSAANGTVSLSADGTRVIYKPKADFSGTDSFTYTVSNTVTIDDGTQITTRVTTDTATVTVTVLAVNDAPVVVNDVATAANSKTAVLVDVLANDTDVESATLTIASVSQGAKGAVAIQSGKLLYTPTASAFQGLRAGQTGTDTFTYTVSDGSGGTATASVTITVTGTNDLPVITSFTKTTAEETAYQFQASDFSNGAVFTDVDTGDVLSRIKITAVPATSTGTLQLFNGTAWVDVTATQLATTPLELTVAELNAGKLRFMPAANYAGAATFKWKGADEAGAYSTNEATVTIQTTAANDAPVFTAGATLAAVAEDVAAATAAGATVTALFAAKFSDPDTGASMGGIVVVGNAAATEGSWQYSADNGASWANVGTVSDSSALALAAAAKLRFVPAANYSGTPPGLSVRAVDDTYAGGWSTNAAPVKVAVTAHSTAIASGTTTLSTSVTAVNDAPALSGDATLAAIAEDAGTTPAGATVSTLFGGLFADVDAGASLAGIAIIGNTANAATEGKWQYSSDGSNWRDVDGVADGATALAVSAASKLRFVAVADYSGTPPGLSVRAIDNSYAGNWSDSALNSAVKVNTTVNGGTTAIAGTVRTLNTSVTAVNDAPTLTGGATLATIAEDHPAPPGATVAALFDAKFGDIDSGAGLAGIAIVASPDSPNGVWQYSANGTDWTAISTVSDTDALMLDRDALLRFLPSPDFSGNAPSLTIRAVDNSYTGSWTTNGTPVRVSVATNGATTAFSQNTQTVSTAVTGANDAPTIAPGTASGAEDSPIAITGLSVADNEGAANVEVTLSVADGTLTLGTATGLSFTTGTGSGDAAVVFRGSIADVNAALATLSYQGDANFNGADTLDISVSDLDATAPQVTTSSVAISVAPVNDAPIVSGPATLTAMTEDGSTTITLAQLLANATDVEGDALSVSGVAVSSGGIVDNGNGTWTYTPVADFNGNVTFSYQVQDAGGGTSAATATLDVAATNDAPTLGPLTNTLGSAVPINAPGASWGYFDHVTRLSDGRMVASWGSGFAGFRILDQDGVPQGSQSTLLTGALAPSANSWVRATVAALSDGGFVIVADNELQVDAFLFDSSGTFLDAAHGGPGRITLAAQNGQAHHYPSVTALSGGGFAVSWRNSIDGSTGDISVKILDNSGAVVVGTTQANTNPALMNYQTNSVIDLGGGRIAVFWATANSTGGSGQDIDGQIFTLSGSALVPLGGEFRVNAASFAGDQVEPQATALTDGSFVVAYADASPHLRHFHLDAGGNPVGVDVPLNTATLTPAPSNLGFPTVLGLSDGGYVVAWRAYVTSPASTKVVVQHFGADDTQIGDITVITPPSNLAWSHPVGLAEMADGRVALTYPGDSNSDGHEEVLFNTITLGGPTALTFTQVEDGTVVAHSVAELLVKVGDVDGAGSLEGIAVIGTDAASTWEFSTDGTTWTAFGTVSQSAALVLDAADMVRFAPPANWNGSTTFTWRAWDQSDGAIPGTKVNITATGGGSAYSADTGTATVNVPAVNDAPIVSGPATLTAITEDGGTTITLAQLLANASDVELDGLNVANLTSSSGTLTVDGSGWTFTPDPNFAGVVTFAYDVVDGNGAVTPATASLTVNAINDAPTVTAGSASGSEDSPIAITGLAVADLDATGPVEVTLAVVHGTLTLGALAGLTVTTGTGTGDVAMTFTGSIGDVNAALAGLTYLPNPNFFGPDSVSVSVNDLHAVTPLTATASVAISVASVNDAPVIAGPVSLAGGSEDTAYTITLAQLLTTASDIEGEVLGVSGVTPSSGSVAYNGNDTWTFTPDQNFTGAVTFTYQVTDASGGTTAANAELTLAAVNDAPTLTSTKTGLTFVEAAVAIPTSADTLFGGADGFTIAFDVRPTGDGGVLFHQSSYAGELGIWMSVAANGSLTFALDEQSGIGWDWAEATTAAGAVAMDQWSHLAFVKSGADRFIYVNGVEVLHNTIAAGRLAAAVSQGGQSLGEGNFADAFSGALARVQIYDVGHSAGDVATLASGGTTATPPKADWMFAAGSGTTVADLTGLTGAIDITTPTYGAVMWSMAVTEDTALAITGLALADVDAAIGDELEVTIAANHGTLTLTTTAGLTLSAGTFADSASVTFTGTVAAINAALASLSYRGLPNYSGSDQITVTASDLGHSGTGGALSATKTLAVTVLPVNDAPTVSGPVALGGMTEDGSLTISATQLLANASDVDGDVLDIVNVTVDSGSVINNENGTWTYQPAANSSGAVTFSYAVGDGILQTPTTASLTVAPVNDAPTTTAAPIPMVLVGNAGYFATATPASTSLGDLTIEMTVRWDGATGQMQYLLVNGNSSLNGYSVLVDTDGHLLMWRNGQDSFHSTDGFLTDGAVQHLAFVHSGTDWTLYIDGVEKTLGTTDDGTPTAIDGKTYIGGYQSGTTPHSFNGAIGDVRLWEVARSQADLVTNRLDLSPTDPQLGALAGRWTMETVNNTLADVSGHGHAATHATNADWGGSPANAVWWLPTTLPDGTEDTPVTVTAAQLLASVADVDGDTLTITGITASNAAVVNNGNGTFTITPAPNHAGPVLLTYQVADGNGGMLSATALMKVTPVADAPVVTVATAQTAVDTAVPLAISAALADPKEVLSTVAISGVPAGATLSAGTDQGAGIWVLSPGDLAGLTLTPATGDQSEITLNVAVTATDGASTTTTTRTLHVVVGTEAVLSVNGVYDGSAVTVNQTITGGTGIDTIVGGGGNDTFNIGDGDKVTGGAGWDVARLQVTGSVDLTGLPAGEITGIEAIDLSANDITLTLSAANVAAITSGNLLFIEGNAADIVNLAGAGWNAAGTYTNGTVYNVFTNGIQTVKINSAVTANYTALTPVTVTGGVEANLYTLPLDGDGKFALDLTIDDAGGSDTLDVSNVPSGDRQWMMRGFSRSADGNDLVVSFQPQAGGGRVTVKNHFNGQPMEYASDGYYTPMNLATGLTGGTADDIIVGTAAAETLTGGGGEDEFWGGGGADTIIGSGEGTLHFELATGPVVMSAAPVDQGTGTATLTSEAVTVTFSGIDWIVGSAYGDTLYSGADYTYWELTGGQGNDTLHNGGTYANASYEADVDANGDGFGVVVNLSDTDLQVTGTITATVLKGTALDGWGGTDTLVGMTGAYGSAFADILVGRDMAGEHFNGGRGDDHIDGGEGTDPYYHYEYWDSLSYQDDPGAVIVNLSATDYTVTRADFGGTVTVTSGHARDGWGGTDTIIGIEHVNGSHHDDIVIGSTGDEGMNGHAGSDTLDGGAGSDSLYYSTHEGPARGVAVNLSASSWTGTLAGAGTVTVAAGTALDQWDDVDTVLNFESVGGTTYADVIIGRSTQADTLSGYAGNDYLDGGGGSGHLYANQDSVYGDDGDDTLVYRTYTYFSGGTGTDTLKVVEAGTTDLRGVMGSQMEAIDLSAADSTVVLNAFAVKYFGSAELYPTSGTLTVLGGSGDTVSLNAGWSFDVANQFSQGGRTYNVYTFYDEYYQGIVGTLNIDTAVAVIQTPNSAPVINVAEGSTVTVTADRGGREGMEHGIDIDYTLLHYDDEMAGTMFTDADGNSAGIAITGFTGSGQLQYSLDAGATWQAATGLSAANALLLSTDYNTRLKFVPDTGFSGNVVLSYRLWDQTSGVDGAYADTTTNGGTTAFSTGVATATIPISPQPDWAGGTGDFSVAANWDTGTVPTGTDTATIASGRAVLSAPATLDAVVVKGTGILEVTSGGSLADTYGDVNLSLQDTASLLVSGGTVNMSGTTFATGTTFKLSGGSVGGQYGVLNIDGGFEWTGGTLGGGAYRDNNFNGGIGQLHQNGGATSLTLADDLTIGASSIAELWNTTMTGTGYLVNQGTILVKGGSNSFDVKNAVAGTITIRGTAASGTTADIFHGDYDSSLAGFANYGTVLVDYATAADETVNLTGSGWANAGLFNVVSTGGGADQVNVQQFFKNASFLSVTDATLNFTALTSSAAPSQIDLAGGTVSLYGSAKIANAATLTGTAAMSLSLATAAVLENSAAMTINDGVTWSVSGNGTITNAAGGTLDFRAGAMLADGDAGSQFTVANNGIVALSGTGTGTATIDGIFTNAGTVQVQIAADGASYDCLEVDSFVGGGTLDVTSLYTGWTNGESRQVVSYLNGTGDFDTYTGLDLGGSTVLSVTLDTIGGTELDPFGIDVVAHTVTATGSQNGTAGTDVFAGSEGVDLYNAIGVGTGGGDVVYARGGDDTIKVTNMNFQRIDGGSGTDIVEFDLATLAADVLDLTGIAGYRIDNVEQIMLSPLATSGTLMLNAGAVSAISGSNTLIIGGASGQSVDFADTGWTAGTNDGSYTVYQHTDGQTVQVQNTLTIAP